MKSVRARGRARRFVVGAVAMCLIAASSGALAQGSDSEFAEGAWTGSLVWVVELNTNQASAGVRSGGQFDLTVAGGQVSGSFEYTASGGSATEDGGAADLGIIVVGDAGGTAGRPTLIGTSGLVEGTAQAEGMEIPISFPLSAGEMTPVDLDIVSASCQTVAGNLKTELGQINAMLGSGGGAVTAREARWAATRSGAAGLTSDQATVLSDLLARAADLESQVANGTFDSDALHKLLGEAADFATSLKQSDACGTSSPAEFTTAVSGVVAQMLDLMLANSGMYTSTDFHAVIMAALAAGVIGPGSGSAGAERADGLSAVLGGLLEEAMSQGDLATVYEVYFGAVGLGDSGLAAEALAGIELLK